MNRSFSTSESPQAPKLPVKLFWEWAWQVGHQLIKRIDIIPITIIAIIIQLYVFQESRLSRSWKTQETGLLESTQLEVEDGHLRLHLSESTIHTHSVVGEGNLCNVPSKNLDETRYFSTMGWDNNHQTSRHQQWLQKKMWGRAPLRWACKFFLHPKYFPHF